MLNNNLLAAVLTFAVALGWLRLNDFAAHKGWLESRLSRKIIHMGTGPLFVLCWILFDDAPAARWLAALIPFAITLQFAGVGLGLIHDDAAVKAMSRSGDRREILRGPLFYGIIFVVLTLVYWKDSPVGIVALMLMCGGDGLADVWGRRFGWVKIPWNGEKSWAGSAGMFLGGFLFALGVYAAYHALGVFAAPPGDYLPALAVIAFTGAAVETLPLKDIDNITVTLTAIALGHWLL